MSKSRILLLAGTREAIDVAYRLADHPRYETIASLAGVTRAPRPYPIQTRVGGFGGPEGLADFLRDQDIAAVINATHPFAARISENAERAAALARIPLLRLLRRPWSPEQGDHWLPVPTLSAAAPKLPPGAHVFLATGAQSYPDAKAIACQRSDCQFLLRVIDDPQISDTPTNLQVIIGRPPFDAAAERGLFRSQGITHLVARNSGGRMNVGKLQAARALGLPVLMIERPALTADHIVETPDSAVDWLERMVTHGP